MSNHPQYIILDTRDLIEDYLINTHGYISRRDVTEIVTQCVYYLLNEGEDHSDDPYYQDIFPNLSMLQDFMNNPAKTDEVIVRIIIDETVKLRDGIKSKLIEYGIYCESVLNYFFYGFIDNDVVFNVLPF